MPLENSAKRSKIARRVFGSYCSTVDDIAAMDRHCRECAAQMRQGGFDVLFANTCAFYAAAAIGRHVELPRVLYLQEPYRMLYEARPDLPWVALPSDPPRGLRYLKQSWRDIVNVQALRIRARQELVNAKSYDAILVNSYFSRESVLRAYNLDTSVCYLGIDTDLFVNQGLPRENFVIGLGEFRHHKNIKFILEAVAVIPSPRPRLVWIGNTSDPAYLEEMKHFAANHQVDFEARVAVSNEELCSLLNRAKAMLYAPRLEPFGFAPLEANACGLPVVAVAEGGVRETVIDGVNGLLVESKPAAMAAAVQRLLGDPGYAAQLGRVGRQRVGEHWALPASIDRLETAITGVAAR